MSRSFTSVSRFEISLQHGQQSRSSRKNTGPCPSEQATRLVGNNESLMVLRTDFCVVDYSSTFSANGNLTTILTLVSPNAPLYPHANIYFIGALLATLGVTLWASHRRLPFAATLPRNRRLIHGLDSSIGRCRVRLSILPSGPVLWKTTIL